MRGLSLSIDFFEAFSPVLPPIRCRDPKRPLMRGEVKLLSPYSHPSRLSLRIDFLVGSRELLSRVNALNDLQSSKQSQKHGYQRHLVACLWVTFAESKDLSH
jgi:hypothetical protein